MNLDMTKNRPIKVIVQFGLSILFGNLFQQLYNMVDSIIVGKLLGVEALAAVGSTGSLSFLVLGFVIGMSTGFGIPVAQFIGARDEKNVQRCIMNSIYLSVIISVVITLLTMLSARWLLDVMNTPADIYNEAYNYIIVMFAGLGFMMFYNLFMTISRAMGDVVTPLVFLLVSSVLNVVLDYVLVKYTPMGTAGAAVATVVSQAVAAVGCIIVMYRKHEVMRIHKEERRFEGKIILRLMQIGLPMALQFSVTAVGTIIVQTAVNSLGSLVVASVTAALRIQNVLTQPLEAMGVTMATFCGQNYGANKMERIKKGVLQSTVLVFGISLVCVLVVYSFGGALTGIFIKGNNAELIGYAKQFMMINGFFYWALGVLTVLRNAIQGLGFAGAAMLAGVFETIGRLIVALGLVANFGFSAVCFANPVAWVAADILLIVVYVIVIKKLEKRMQLAA